MPNSRIPSKASMVSLGMEMRFQSPHKNIFPPFLWYRFLLLLLWHSFCVCNSYFHYHQSFSITLTFLLNQSIGEMNTPHLCNGYNLLQTPSIQKRPMSGCGGTQKEQPNIAILLPSIPQLSKFTQNLTLAGYSHSPPPCSEPHLGHVQFLGTMVR